MTDILNIKLSKVYKPNVSVIPMFAIWIPAVLLPYLQTSGESGSCLEIRPQGEFQNCGT